MCFWCQRPLIQSLIFKILDNLETGKKVASDPETSWIIRLKPRQGRTRNQQKAQLNVASVKQLVYFPTRLACSAAGDTTGSLLFNAEYPGADHDAQSWQWRNNKAKGTNSPDVDEMSCKLIYWVGVLETIWGSSLKTALWGLLTLTDTEIQRTCPHVLTLKWTQRANKLFLRPH